MWMPGGRTESAEIDGLERRRTPSSIGAPIAGRYCKAGAVSDTLTRLRRMTPGGSLESLLLGLLIVNII